MRDRGFTLIETVVVVAILAILALVGIESIIEFQKNALLEGTADEFASILRAARTKSLGGELLEGETAGDFEVQGLPKHGVRVDAGNYFSFRQYQLAGDPAPTSEDLEILSISDDLSLTPSGEGVIFDRVTGAGHWISGALSSITFTLQRDDGRGTREITVDDKGITVQRS